MIFSHVAYDLKPILRPSESIPCTYIVFPTSATVSMASDNDVLDSHWQVHDQTAARSFLQVGHPHFSEIGCLERLFGQLQAHLAFLQGWGKRPVHFPSSLVFGKGGRQALLLEIFKQTYCINNQYPDRRHSYAELMMNAFGMFNIIRFLVRCEEFSPRLV